MISETTIPVFRLLGPSGSCGLLFATTTAFRSVDLHKLAVIGVRARGRLVHDLGNDNTCLPAAWAKRFMRVAVRNDNGIRRRGARVEKLRGRWGIGIVAGHGEANVYRVGHGNAGRAQRRPVLAIVAGVTGEDAANSAKAQPGRSEEHT